VRHDDALQLGDRPALGAQIQLAPDVLQVPQLSVRAGEGRLTGSGTLGWRPYTLTTIALTLNAARFRVIDTRRYTAAVSGWLACCGPLEQPFIRGALEVEEATLRPELSLLRSAPPAPDPTIVVVQTAQDLTAPPQPAKPVTEEEETERPSPMQSDVYRQLGMDLTVTVTRGTWVHLDEGSLEVMGQVHVRKQPGEEVSLAGSLETVRGWYVFYGRKFRFERGQVAFTGTSPIDPSLDIVARYTLPQYQVDVAIGGTVRTPTLTLRSDPQLAQVDILSLLLFGKPADRLDDGEKRSLQSQAVQ